MQRIQGDYATEDNLYTEGNPAAGVPATVVTAAWLNGVQEELMAVIETAGLEADEADLTQLYKAIEALIAEGIPEPVSATTGWTPRGLTVLTTGTDANVAIAAKSLVLADADGHVMELPDVAVNAATTASGAGGLDTGAVATNTWYAVHVIADGDGNVAGLLSLSADVPTLPAGYTYSRRVGWVRTGDNTYPLAVAQRGGHVQYYPTSDDDKQPLISSGNLSSSPYTMVELPVAAFVPPTALAIEVLMFVSTLNETIGGASLANVPYSADLGSGVHYSNNHSYNRAMSATKYVRLTLLGDAIYAGSYRTGGCYIRCLGWEDAI